MNKPNLVPDLDLWESLTKEIRMLTPNELFNKLADHEPELYKNLIDDARLWLTEALYNKLRNLD